MIDINQTNRLIYRNALIVAKKYSDNTQLSFIDSDGADIGIELRTNSEGFISYGNYNTRPNGVYVSDKAIIKVSFDGGESFPVSWVCEGSQGSSIVNDGKIKDKNGNVVFSANSATDYTLDYNHLKNAPTPKQWGENEQVEIISTWGQGVTVGVSTTVLRIKDDSTLLEQNDNCSYDKAIWLLFTREGQQVVIINESGGNLLVFNTSSNIPQAEDVDYSNLLLFTNCSCYLNNAYKATVLGSKRIDANTYSFNAISRTPHDCVLIDSNNNKQYTLTVDTWGQTYNVPKDCSVLVIELDTDCVNMHGRTFKAAVALNVSRPGQIVEIINNTGEEVFLFNNAMPSSFYAEDDDEMNIAKCTAYIERDDSITIAVGTVDGVVNRFWGCYKYAQSTLTMAERMVHLI